MRSWGSSFGYGFDDDDFARFDVFEDVWDDVGEIALGEFVVISREEVRVLFGSAGH